MTSDLAERITADFAYAQAHLRSMKPIPDHEWMVLPSEIDWFAGNVLKSVAGGASIFLRRMPFDPLLEDQLHIEVRLFWDEPVRREKPVSNRARACPVSLGNQSH